MIGVIKKVLALSGDLAPRLRLSFLWSIVESLFESAPFIALFIVFDRIVRADEITAQTVWFVVAVLVSGLAIRIVCKYFVYRYQSGTGYEIVARERLNVGDRMRRVPMGFFSKNNLGQITATVTSDLAFLEMYAMHVLDKVAGGLINTLVVTIVIFFFDWRMGLIFLAGLGAGLFVFRFMQSRAVDASVRQRDAQAGMVAAVLEYVRGIGVIKAFNLAGRESDRLGQTFRDHSDAAYMIEARVVPLVSFYGLCFRIAAGGILFLAPVLVLIDEMTPVMMVVAVIASFTIYTPVEILGSLTSMVRLMDASLNRVDALTTVPLIDENVPDVQLESFDIAFDDVSFGYTDEVKVLDGVSFVVPERSMTAIVGPSGSGKTTVTRLIGRFWDVSSGQVRVGGHDVREMTSDSLLRQISTVFQNVFLFNDTIMNNIRFGNPAATDAEVIVAARKARCHDFVEALPDGYDSIVGENGHTLSGGERQRVSIARAILKNAPIVLLDEATASVDPENEYLIQEAIAELVREKTLVVIAHKLSTIRHADQILVLRDGNIQQRGTHDDLISQPGTYRDFWHVRERAAEWTIASSH